MKENNVEMTDDASSAFDIYLYLLSEVKEYSQTTLNVQFLKFFAKLLK